MKLTAHLVGVDWCIAANCGHFQARYRDCRVGRDASARRRRTQASAASSGDPEAGCVKDLPSFGRGNGGPPNRGPELRGLQGRLAQAAGSRFHKRGGLWTPRCRPTPGPRVPRKGGLLARIARCQCSQRSRSDAMVVLGLVGAAGNGHPVWCRLAERRMTGHAPRQAAGPRRPPSDDATTECPTESCWLRRGGVERQLRSV